MVVIVSDSEYKALLPQLSKLTAVPQSRETSRNCQHGEIPGKANELRLTTACAAISYSRDLHSEDDNGELA